MAAHWFGGLSPPTRGSRARSPDTGAGQRSIPAHAGEPFDGTARTTPARVYPRPRGGAPSIFPFFFPNHGLSPPTRGSQKHSRRRHAFRRSIPAHAGEPRKPLMISPLVEVYPRPRGGAIEVQEHDELAAGLSPPTRGSHRCATLRWRPLGSIPAHAGEPIGCLSETHRPTGSIPAHAGEPRPSPERWSCAQVYPRPRGSRESPTRGSRTPFPYMDRPRRSIPAHAGEPHSGHGDYSPSRVYPRPRGGAKGKGLGGTTRTGLSPPTRGSRWGAQEEHLTVGSIPAHAGEPCQLSC